MTKQLREHPSRLGIVNRGAAKGARQTAGNQQCRAITVEVQRVDLPGLFCDLRDQAVLRVSHFNAAETGNRSQPTVGRNSNGGDRAADLGRRSDGGHTELTTERQLTVGPLSPGFDPGSEQGQLLVIGPRFTLGWHHRFESTAGH